MKNKKIWLYLIILGIFSGQVICESKANEIDIKSSRSNYRSVRTHIEVLNPSPNGGTTDILFQVISLKQKFRTFSFEVIVSSNIEYSGEIKWSIDMGDDTLYEKNIEINIPNNDTSKFSILIASNGQPLPDHRYFVTGGDTLEITTYDPKFYARDKSGHGGPGAWTADPTLPKPDIKPHQHTEHKGHKYSIITLTKEEQQLQEMHELERTPLTEHSSQDFIIGDKWYRRYRGESKFKLFQPYKDVDEYLKQHQDSINAIPDTTQFKVCLQLNNPEKLNFAKSILGDTINSTIDPNYYHLIITKAHLINLAKKGISVIFFDKFDHIHGDDIEIKFIPLNSLEDCEKNNKTPIYFFPPTLENDSLKQNTIPSQGDASKALELVWSSRMYPSTWINQWDAYDLEPMNGYDYWGSSTIETNALWCNGTGDRQDGTPYDQMMNSYLESEAIDVSEYYNLEFRYRLKYDIHPLFDNLATEPPPN